MSRAGGDNALPQCGLHYLKTNGPTLAGVTVLAYRFGFIATDQNQGVPDPKFGSDVKTYISKEMEIFTNYIMKFSG